MWTGAEIRAAITLALIGGTLGATFGYVAGPSIILDAAADSLFFVIATALGTVIEYVVSRGSKS
jgi:uncharacterized membrane protein